MILSPNRLLAFVHIPHTGGTSIETAWEKSLMLPTDYVDGSGPAKHVPAREVRGWLVTPEEFDGWCFLTVHRNPWGRVFSEWCHLVDDYQRWTRGDPFRPQREWLERMRAAFEAPSFAEWVLCTWAPSRMESPWEYYCHDVFGDCLIKRVLRFAHLAEDWAELCLDRGIGPVYLPQDNKLDHGDYTDHYTPAAIVAVANVCRPELDRFKDQYGEPA